ncbi:MAG: hypothetical protein M1818_001527 [Claussenomyces sp. TS43310]|nr:MAG: hypothetical protein M1818_001527 [Claussenomyces sp. TS43310]
MPITPTSKRAPTRPRPFISSTNTVSTPNLAAVYNGAASTQLRPNFLARKASLNALTPGSLATIPDASNAYPLSTVLDDEDSLLTAGKMSQRTPQGGGAGDVDMGDWVDVPGNMHGIVKFVGSVQGKKGTFAGVELSEEFAARGKNNGDVDGVSYFVTSISGAGIFLPVNRAVKRTSPPGSRSSHPDTPGTPSLANPRNAASSGTYTPPTPSLPKFSQSVGPGRAPSPQFKKSRPSLPRPESPIRRLGTPGTRPSFGTPTAKSGVRYVPSPTPGKFSQSVRGTRDVGGDPAKKLGHTPKPGLKSSIGPRSASALGQNPLNYSDDENTPVGIARTTDVGSLGSISSFSAKIQPAESRANAEELARLRAQLDERDKQLREQASSLAEMESSLAEVQSLMGGSDAGSRANRGSMEDKDASQLRTVLREKNEKIAMLTAEFDAHRADFRSTIDTLELASTETERVYEKRVEDLLQEIREYQDRNEDVDSVARQLKQLEELVQELEEGLEDARRGEAEARGEVEFLRGEVERGRSELRREREKAAAAQHGATVSGDGPSLSSKELEQRDDEIRGLKAIIHSLSRDAVPDSPDLQKTPTQRSSMRLQNNNQEHDRLERELSELRYLVEAKTNREEELERELEKFRRGSASGSFNNQRASAMTIGSNGTVTQERSNPRDSKGTVASWRDRELPRGPETHKRGNTLETMAESDAYSSATDSSALWCEICETGGHDILTCTNMFGNQQHLANTASADKHVTDSGQQQQQQQPPPPPPQLHSPQWNGREVVTQAFSPKLSGDEFKPAPLASKKSNASTPIAVIPNPMDQGPLAGKESGRIDLDRWCALCERDGHESVDCPFEDAF